MFNTYSFNVFIRNFVLSFFTFIVEAKKNLALYTAHEHLHFLLNVNYSSVGSTTHGQQPRL